MNETAQEQGTDERKSLKTLTTLLVPGSFIVPATKDFYYFHSEKNEDKKEDYLSMPEFLINISLPGSAIAEAGRLGIYYGLYKLIDYLV